MGDDINPIPGIFMSREPMEDVIAGDAIRKYIESECRGIMRVLDSSVMYYQETQAANDPWPPQSVGVANPNGIEKLKLTPAQADDSSSRKRAARLD